MTYFFRASVALLTFIPSLALADEAKSGAGVTIGQRLSAFVTESWSPLLLLIVMAFGLVGVIFIGKGVMKLVQAGQNGQSPNYNSALVYLFCGTMLISLPDTAGIGMMSVLGEVRGGSALGGSGLDYNHDKGMSGDFLAAINGGAKSPGAVSDCTKITTPAACIAKNISQNVVGIATYVLFAFTFLIGLVMLANVIMDMARSSEQNAQGSKALFARSITAILLMNAPMVLGMVSMTLFGTSGSITSSGLDTSHSILQYKSPSEVKIIKDYAELIAHGFLIMAFFGAWSFIRGILMIKSTAEGRGNGNLGMAGVYIVAGVMMANMKMASCYGMTTFLGTASSTGLCS